ncbi:MAG: GNAT family N-acetyltransferase [Odoribacteraceae bacterium]|nr:GNAT family N-acetyltransferase [Odoribacteraceae bacterium]
MKKENRGEITFRRITDPLAAPMTSLLPLYTSAFPPVERRDAGQLARVIARREAFFFNAIWSGEELSGLFAYWRLRDFYYLEHLAIFAPLRGQGIGHRALSLIADLLPGTRLLEVEPPDAPLPARRVAYYRRHGYEVLDKAYAQPPYDGRRPPFPLWIMGNCRPPRLSEHLARVKQEVYADNENI